MKFLVLGCNGMVGHMVSVYMKEAGHDVHGFAKKESPFINTILGNAKELPLLYQTIRTGGYDAVINCIGVLNQFAEADHDAAVFLNSYLPHYLGKITSDMDTQIIHISTDCVFSGKKGSYSEEDVPDGEFFYDRSKALGELNDDKNITFRNSVIGPDINETGIGLLNWFLQQKDTVYGYCKANWTGQTTLQLAKTIEAATRAKVHGLYHMVPNKAIDKYDLLCLINKYIRKKSIVIKPQSTFVTDKSLIRKKMEFNYQIPDYEIMIQELGDWMRKHKEIYPQYDL